MSLVLPEQGTQFQVAVSLSYDKKESFDIVDVAHSSTFEYQCGWKAESDVCSD